MRRNKRKTKRKISVTTKLMFLLLISLVITSISMSRYQTTLQRTSASQVADWLFSLELNNNQIQDSFQINLIDTITTTSDKVKANVIAPNTAGSFTFNIDCTQCEVGVTYEIKITDVNDNIPSGLKFYKNSTYSQADEIVLDTAYTNSLTLNQLSTIKTETVYWKWFTEDSTTTNESDTLYNGETLSLNISITGTQSIT